MIKKRIPHWVAFLVSIPVISGCSQSAPTSVNNLIPNSTSSPTPVTSPTPTNSLQILSVNPTTDSNNRATITVLFSSDSLKTSIAQITSLWSISCGKPTVAQGSPTSIALTPDSDSGTTTAVLSLPDKLANYSGGDCTVTASSKIQDTSGNYLGYPLSYTFTIGTPPNILSFSPAAGTISTLSTVTVTFDSGTNFIEDKTTPGAVANPANWSLRCNDGTIIYASNDSAYIKDNSTASIVFKSLPNLDGKNCELVPTNIRDTSGNILPTKTVTYSFKYPSSPYAVVWNTLAPHDRVFGTNVPLGVALYKYANSIETAKSVQFILSDSLGNKFDLGEITTATNGSYMTTWNTMSLSNGYYNLNVRLKTDGTVNGGVYENAGIELPVRIFNSNSVTSDIESPASNGTTFSINSSIVASSTTPQILYGFKVLYNVNYKAPGHSNSHPRISQITPIWRDAYGYSKRFTYGTTLGGTNNIGSKATLICPGDDSDGSTTLHSGGSYAVSGILGSTTFFKGSSNSMISTLGLYCTNLYNSDNVPSSTTKGDTYQTDVLGSEPGTEFDLKCSSVTGTNDSIPSILYGKSDKMLNQLGFSCQ